MVLRLTIMARAGAEDDMDATLADNIRRKGSRFREKDQNADDEYDFDGGIEMYESRKQKGTKVRETMMFVRPHETIAMGCQASCRASRAQRVAASLWHAKIGAFANRPHMSSMPRW